MDKFTILLALAMWVPIALNLWAGRLVAGQPTRKHLDTGPFFVRLLAISVNIALSSATIIMFMVLMERPEEVFWILVPILMTGLGCYLAWNKMDDPFAHLTRLCKSQFNKLADFRKARADRRLASAQYREDVREEKRRLREKQKALQPRMAKRAMRVALAKCRAAAQDEPDVFEELLDSMGLLASMTGSTESQLARLVRRAQKLERYIKLLKKDAINVSESLQRMVDRLGETHDLINEIVQTVSATAPIICEIVCDLPGARREDAISKLDDLVGKYAELYARCVSILGESVDGLLNGEQTETHPELRSLLARTSSTPHDISPRLDDLIRESARPSTPSSKAITKS